MAVNSAHAEVMRRYCPRAQPQRSRAVHHDPRECGRCSRLLRLKAEGKALSQEVANRIDVNQSPLRKNEAFFLPPPLQAGRTRCPICSTTWISPEPLSGVCNSCNVDVERGTGVSQAPAVQLTPRPCLVPPIATGLVASNRTRDVRELDRERAERAAAARARPVVLTPGNKAASGRRPPTPPVPANVDASGHLNTGRGESQPSASSGQHLSAGNPTAAPSGQNLATGGVGAGLPDSALSRVVEQVAAASISAPPPPPNNVPPPPTHPPPPRHPPTPIAGHALVRPSAEEPNVVVNPNVVDPTNDQDLTRIRMVQSPRSYRFSDSFIDDVFQTVSTQGVIEDNLDNWVARDFGDVVGIARSQTIAAITGRGSPELPSILEVVVSSGQHLTTSGDRAGHLGADPAVAKFRTIVNSWRLFVFRLATVVMALFDMKNMLRFQHFFFQRQPDPANQAVELWVPDLRLWPSALDVISLSAAKHSFLDRIISPMVLRKRCSPDSLHEDPPEDMKRPSEHDLDFWSDSTVNFNCRLDLYVNSKWVGQQSKWRPKKHSLAKDLALAVGGYAHESHGTVACGGTLNELLGFVEAMVNGAESREA